MASVLLRIEETNRISESSPYAETTGTIVDSLTRAQNSTSFCRQLPMKRRPVIESNNTFTALSCEIVKP